MALLTTGLSLFQTPEFGKSGFDVFSESALRGVGTLDQLRQRDIDRTFKEGEEGRSERRTTAIEERTDIARTATESRSTEAAARATSAAATLAENKRQFDARLKAGDFGPAAGAGAGSTGPERMSDLATDAFISSGYYPDTPEGQALARLRSTGLIGKGLVTPQDRFEFATDLGKDILLFNPDMTPEQAQARAVEFTNGLGDSFNEADSATLDLTDPREGRTFQNGRVNQTGVVEKVGEDQYIIRYPVGPPSNPVSGAVIDELVGAQ